ncbi:hypothetical protein BJX61DRAFT_547795, partial [Aspergillus egyptiacus]
VLSGIQITSLDTLAQAITTLHKTYSIPHVIITSVQLSKLLPSPANPVPSSPSTQSLLTIIGSTITSTGQPRLFRIDVPAIDCFFSGTGDMFAALTVARLREAVFADPDANLRNKRSWVPDDSVPATELPLAKATEKVLASMHNVLEKTIEARDKELAATEAFVGEDVETKKKEHLRRTKAAEVRLVRNARFLRTPTVEFKAQDWHV